MPPSNGGSIGARRLDGLQRVVGPASWSNCSAQSEKAQNSQNDDDCSNEPNNAVHDLSSLCLIEPCRIVPQCVVLSLVPNTLEYLRDIEVAARAANLKYCNLYDHSDRV